MAPSVNLLMQSEQSNTDTTT